MSDLSKRKGPFMVMYRYKGGDYTFVLPAGSWAEAQDRIRSIGMTGEVVGSSAQQIRTNPVTLPFVAAGVRIVVWWRNLWRNR